MGNDAVELRAIRVFGIDVGWIDVARHRGEKLDVLDLQHARQLSGIADVDLVKGMVLDQVQGVLHRFRADYLLRRSIYLDVGQSQAASIR